jgi:hypothetical protein
LNTVLGRGGGLSCSSQTRRSPGTAAQLPQLLEVLVAQFAQVEVAAERDRFAAGTGEFVRRASPPLFREAALGLAPQSPMRWDQDLADRRCPESRRPA